MSIPAEGLGFDPYVFLKVEASASKEAVGKAARKLGLKYHPDKNKDDPEAPALFLQVQKAKEFLLDEVKRKEYDDTRTATAKRKQYDNDRSNAMDDKRKRMRDDLEQKVRAAAASASATGPAASSSSSSTQGVAQQKRDADEVVNRLRQENQSILEQAAQLQNRRKQEQMDHRRSLGPYQLKVKWDSSQKSHTEDSVLELFRSFGDIEDVLIAGSRGTTAVITFTTLQSARAAVNAFAVDKLYRVSLLGDDGSRRDPPVSAQGSSVGTETSTSSSASAGTVPPTNPALAVAPISAAALLSKESDVLQRMREAAKKKKEALSANSSTEVAT